MQLFPWKPNFHTAASEFIFFFNQLRDATTRLWGVQKRKTTFFLFNFKQVLKKKRKENEKRDNQWKRCNQRKVRSFLLVVKGRAAYHSELIQLDVEVIHLTYTSTHTHTRTYTRGPTLEGNSASQLLWLPATVVEVLRGASQRKGEVAEEVLTVATPEQVATLFRRHMAEVANGRVFLDAHKR